MIKSIGAAGAAGIGGTFVSPASAAPTDEAPAAKRRLVAEELITEARSAAQRDDILNIMNPDWSENVRSGEIVEQYDNGHVLGLVWGDQQESDRESNSIKIPDDGLSVDHIDSRVILSDGDEPD